MPIPGSSTPRRPKIVCAVVVAHLPRNAAGNTWAFLNWVLGLQQAGCDVWMVEHLNRSDLQYPEGAEAPAESLHERTWRRAVEQHGLQERATLFLDDDAPNAEAFTRWAADADAFINISGQFKLDHRVAHLPRRAYVDLDPAFTQLWAETLGVDMNYAPHTHFFTVGAGIGTTARIPVTPQRWIPTLPAVSLPHWTQVADAPLPVDPRGCWTTVTHWHGYKSIPWDGRLHGDKRESLVTVRELPQRGPRLLAATDMEPSWTDYAEFSACGWRFVPAADITAEDEVYRAFLAAGLGEFSVAKQGYVVSRSGWFSDRSACYLALGRPVVLQDTGWTDVLPSDAGLLAWNTLDEAAEVLRAVEADLPRHRAAARRIAEEYLDARKVMAKVLDHLGLAVES
ncbi:MAG: hypothetical protein JSR82_02060 [Verrucomicrobia bacterium]|nr:hypothetical protein [Verrucomicrobiota bacterium]